MKDFPGRQTLEVSCERLLPDTMALASNVLQSSFLLINRQVKLLKTFWGLGLECHQYVGDIQFCLSSLSDVGKDCGESELLLGVSNGLRAWVKASNLKYNPDKTEVLLIRSRNQVMNYYLFGMELYSF